MSKAFLRVVLLGFVAVVLQGTVLPHFAVFGGRVNVLVAVVTVVSLSYGALAGLMAGFGIGLLADLVLGTALGLAALPLVLIGFFTGYLERHVYRDAYLVPVVVGFLGTAFFELTVLALSNVAFAVWWRRAFVSVFIPTVLVNAALMPWVHQGLNKLLPSQREELD